MTKTRMEAFTDAVIAIIMTILVLEIGAPEETAFEALWAMRSRFAVYAVSFFSLAIYWNNHHHLFHISKVVDGKVLWSNIVFLFSLSFFPFATAWVDEHLLSLVPEITYGVVVLFADICYAVMACQLARANGPQSDIAKVLAGYGKMKMTIAVNVVGLVLGFVWPPLVITLYALSLIPWVVPEKRIEAYYRGKSASEKS